MENKVGDNVPAPKKIEDLLQQTANQVEQLQAFCVTLHPEERSATIKPPAGTDALARSVHELATRHEVTVKNVPLDGMMNDLRLAETMPRFQAIFALGAQLVADTMLQAKSEYYSAFLSYYDALLAAAEHDPMLAAEMRPIQDAMRKLHRGSRSGASKNTSSAATPSENAVKNG